MMRRRRDQTHPRHRMAQPADVVGHLAARQLAAFARLGALRHLDLDLVRAAQILGCHAKAARGHLLDFGAHGIARAQGVIDLKHVFAQQVGHSLALHHGDALELLPVTRRVFATLARVALAPKAVHGHRQRGVRFGGDGTERHGTRGETLDDFFGRLNLVHRDGFGGI